MKMIDYELTCDISYLFEKKIFIYGTGVYGKRVAKALLQMKVEIGGFCETNPEKNEFMGKRIISIISLIQNYDRDDILVIIASEKYHKEMFCELQIARKLNICTYYSLFVSLYLNSEAKEMVESVKKDIELFKKISLNMAVMYTWRVTRGYYDIWEQPELVWLYQPGKVASKTIHVSCPSKVYHVHSLAYAFNIDVCDTYSQMFDKIKENPIKIITGVREPISRDISAFFQGTEINIWPFIRYDSLLYSFDDYSKQDVKKLDNQLMKNKVCEFEKNLNYSFEHIGKEIVENRSDEFSWFDYEIKALLGVDIYAYPFDREKGYTIIEQDNIRILVYKCEKLNQLGKVIGEFVGEPEFSFNNANQGDEKIYSYVYKRFKEEVKLNKLYFDYYYNNNPRVKHFYTDSEIEQFKNKWEKKVQ